MANPIITKPDTSGFTHIKTTGIKAVQPKEDGTAAVFNCIRVLASGDTVESVYKASPNMLKRLLHGNGAAHKDMLYGLKALSHFNGHILFDPEKDEAVGIHMVINNNYASADMSEELEMRLLPNNAVIQVYDSGEIDVLAFPYKLFRHIEKFLSTLEKVQSFEVGDQIKFEDITATVASTTGEFITFRCREKTNIV